MGWEKESLKWSRSPDHGHHAHIHVYDERWAKKIFFCGTKRLMTLKVYMQHRVLAYFQVCSNDDPGLTSTYFTAKSNLVHYAIVWEKGKTMDFSGTIVVYDTKWVHEPSWISNIWIRRTFIQGHSDSTFSNFFSLESKPLGLLKPNFM